MKQARVQPKLGAPGAGLPLFERLVARYFFLPVKARQTSWEQSNFIFSHETDKILRLTASMTLAQMQEPVLIPRIRGIEDSSRFWSPAMVMEHLMIVAPAMADVVVRLSCGEVPDVQVDVARVKPSGGLSGAADIESIRSAFASAMMQAHLRVSEEVRDRNSRARLLHPWFGPLSAREWNWLLGSHQWVHRKQIQAILKVSSNHSGVV